MSVYDAVIVGGGPAGLSSACAFRGNGKKVLLIDQNPAVGGQFWKHAEIAPRLESKHSKWHHHWQQFRDLKRDFLEGVEAGELEYVPNASVSRIDHAQESGPARFTLSLSGPLGSPEVFPEGLVSAANVFYCAGTYDRQLPVEGWTLPGVMAAGGIQTFIKENGFAPGQRFVVAGTGPFLMAAAATVIKAGAKVEAIIDASNPTAWFPRGVSAVLVPSKIKEALGYSTLLARHGVKFHFNSVVSKIESTASGDGVSAVLVRKIGADSDAQDKRYGVDAVGLNWGFIPQLDLLLQLRGETHLSADNALVATVDKNFESSVEGFYVVGEGNGVSGVLGAVAEGSVAVRKFLGEPVSLRDRYTVTANNIFAQAFQRAGRIPENYMSDLAPDTVVCRCEDVTSDALQHYFAEDTSPDARAAKGVTRVGMGNCQGRMCGFGLCHAADEQRGKKPSACSVSTTDLLHRDLHAMSVRPLANPVSLESLAQDTE